MFGLILHIRHWLYDKGILPSFTVDIPTICVGNLAVGGTGKTPHTEYLIRLLSPQYKVAVLSRGYKRKTRGFVLADDTSTAATIGDEAMQIHRKFPDVAVAVCEHRVHGVHQLQRMVPDVQIVILDDAMQHRSLRCGFTILLTAENNLYIYDRLLPFGRLRDLKQRSLAAQAIVVTKCPIDMKPIDKRVIDNRLHLPAYQHLYFSHVVYEPIEISGTKPLVVCGIAHPEEFFKHVKEQFPKAELLAFADHHRFSKADEQRIVEAAQKHDCILTTEKDYERLILTHLPNELKEQIRPVPIRVDLDAKQEEELKRQLGAYIKEELKHLNKNKKA